MMRTEIDPKTSPRAREFEMWKTAGNPNITITKTFDITRLVKVARRSGLKSNMLMCWCIGRAASGIKEFYTLPAGGHLWQYDKLAVDAVVKTIKGGTRLCDIPFSEDIHQFNEDYLRLTKYVYDTDTDYVLADEYMAIDTSAMVTSEIDSVVSVYSEMFINPYLAWGKFRRGFFKITLPISFKAHHAQMDGYEIMEFFNKLQDVFNNLKIN